MIKISRDRIKTKRITRASTDLEFFHNHFNGNKIKIVNVIKAFYNKLRNPIKRVGKNSFLVGDDVWASGLRLRTSLFDNPHGVVLQKMWEQQRCTLVKFLIRVPIYRYFNVCFFIIK